MSYFLDTYEEALRAEKSTAKTTTDEEDSIRSQGKRKIIRNKKLKDCFTVPVLSCAPCKYVNEK